MTSPTLATLCGTDAHKRYLVHPCQAAVCRFSGKFSYR